MVTHTLSRRGRSGVRVGCRFRATNQEVCQRFILARCGASLLPGHVSGVQKDVIRGDPEKISTSYVERFNLSSRMQMRRCTRLTNGFSKKLENHRAAVALGELIQSLPRA